MKHSVNPASKHRSYGCSARSKTSRLAAAAPGIMVATAIQHSGAGAQITIHALASKRRLQHALSSITLPRGVRTTFVVHASQVEQLHGKADGNEQAHALVDGLRGSNIDDSDFADKSVKMKWVDVTTSASSTDSLPLTYDVDAITSYWGRRPFQVIKRILQLISVAGGFVLSYAWDVWRGRVWERDAARAVELRHIMTNLGPAYIKLGQALSIRPDLLSPAAMRELQALCDKVPSFDNGLAMQVIEAELGAPAHQLFTELSPEPVAAASLGQVYKGVLPSGEVVAVKVQRPAVVETVTVDLYILRRLGVLVRARAPQLTRRVDIVPLLDEWAERFFEELDYVREGRNAERFAQHMRKDLPQVVVPRPFSSLTSRRVLTVEWLEGEKLSASRADDVRELVNVGVVCYLKQLLDTGFFHADPHPGNLVRTPDGRLAVLDFGLMTEVGDDIKYGLIEAISHLIHRDYDAIGQDFVTLGFVRPGADMSPILPLLAKVFDRALRGRGGPRHINFQELAADLAQITFDHPFTIPPYFALIIRAVAVLEGIALLGNPDFSLVDAAYPYISRRLLTDPSPRLRRALKYLVYGRSGAFDADRVIELLTALERFQAAAAHATTTTTTTTTTNLPTPAPAAAAAAAAAGPAAAPAAAPAHPHSRAVDSEPGTDASTPHREATWAQREPSPHAAQARHLLPASTTASEGDDSSSSSSSSSYPADIRDGSRSPSPSVPAVFSPSWSPSSSPPPPPSPSSSSPSSSSSNPPSSPHSPSQLPPADTLFALPSLALGLLELTPVVGDVIGGLAGGVSRSLLGGSSSSSGDGSTGSSGGGTTGLLGRGPSRVRRRRSPGITPVARPGGAEQPQVPSTLQPQAPALVGPSVALALQQPPSLSHGAGAQNSLMLPAAPTVGAVAGALAAMSVPSPPQPPSSPPPQPSSTAREALRFIFSPEGAWFRELIIDEVVRSIDALSRDQARALAVRLGLTGLHLPVVLPGARAASLPLAPALSGEERRVVDNVMKLVAFLTRGRAGGGGQAGGAGGGQLLDASLLSELLPVLPTVAVEVVPQLVQRLTSRLLARLLRDLYA